MNAAAWIAAIVLGAVLQAPAGTPPSGGGFAPPAPPSAAPVLPPPGSTPSSPGPASPSTPPLGPSSSSQAAPQSTPPSAPPAGALPSIAMMPIDAVLPQYAFGTGPSGGGEPDCGRITKPGVDLAKRLTLELIEAMVATRRFRVIDRDTIDRVLNEQNFHRVQGMDPKELARLGKLLGADRLVISSLDLAGTECRRVEVRASGYLAFEFGGGIEVAYRVVNVATGEIETLGRITRTFDSRQNPELRDVLASPEAAIVFFSRQAAAAETGAVLDAIDPVKVAAVQDGMVVLNQGRGRPMVSGMTLRVMIRGEPIRDPDTGAILSEEAGEAAIVRVVDVDERLSRARVVAGDPSKIAVGARCRTIDVPSVIPGAPQR